MFSKYHGAPFWYMSTIQPTLRWVDLLNESVHTSDDSDIGDIEAVNREFIVVKRGF